MPSGPRKRVSNASDDSIVDEPSRVKKSKIETTKNLQSLGSFKPQVGGVSKVDVNGDKYWEISKMRRVTISSFRGKTMVNIREYYEKDGQELPGKKGISLPIDQFSTLLTLLPNIEDVLRECGESIARPNYCIEASKSSDGENHNMCGINATRKNIEATSDEDESD